MYKILFVLAPLIATGCQHHELTEVYHCKSIASYPSIAIGMDCNGRDVLLLDDSR